MFKNKKTRFLEFLLIGVLMGVIEDVIAIFVATDEQIDWRVIWVVFLVAIPFAFLSEYVVDHPMFWEKVSRSKSWKDKLLAKLRK